MNDQNRWDALRDAIANDDQLAPDDMSFVDGFHSDEAELEREVYRQLSELGSPLPVSAADRARAEATLAEARARLVRGRSRWPLALLTGAMAAAAAALVWLAIPTPEVAESGADRAALGIAQDGSASTLDDGEVTLRKRGRADHEAPDPELADAPEEEPAEASPEEPLLIIEDEDPAVPETSGAGSTRPLARSSATAGELLAAARAHVAHGDEKRALSTYATLQRRHPSSAEALAANVSVGELQLRRGRVKTALQAFDRYLSRGGGPLAEEAHWGRIRALDRLGRIPARDAAIEMLRKKHPKSVYVSRASSL